MSKSLTFCFYAFIFLSILLQGHGIAMLALNMLPLFVFLIFVLKQLDKLTISSYLINTTIYLAVVTLFFIWLGYKDPYIEHIFAIKQGINISITISIVVIGIFLHENKLLDISKLLYAMMAGVFCYFAIKLVAISLIFAGVITIKEFLSFMMSAFNMSLVPGTIPGGLIRLQTSMDIIPIFLMLFVLSYNRSNQKELRFTKTFITVVILNTIIAYSRVQFAVLLLPLSYYFAFFFSPKKKIYLVFFAIIAIAVSYDVLSVLIEDRFFSQASSESDRIRIVQMHFLIDKWLQSPLIGFGCGGYDWRLIRNKASFYSYEVQWLQILMQFGIIGLSLYLVPFVCLFKKVFVNAIDIDKTTQVAGFIVFLLMGFTNPYLIGRPAGILFLLFWLNLSNMSFSSKEEENIG